MRSEAFGTLFALLLCCGCGAYGHEVATLFATASSKNEAKSYFRTVERALALKNSEGLWPLFAQWQLHFQTNYSAEESMQRYLIFEANVRRIIAVNNNDSITHWAGLTKFSAMTADEARASLLGPGFVPPAPERGAGPTWSVLKAELPKRKDWHAEGIMTRVKDQGNCGACWALTGVAAIEAKVKAQTGKAVHLSEQQLLDCHPTSYACAGGWLDHPFAYAASTPLVSEKVYPYTAGGCIDAPETDSNCFEGRCPASPALCRNCRIKPGPGSRPRYQLTGSGYEQVPPYSKDELMKAVALHGPVAVAMRADDDLFSYAGGIYTKPEGSCGAPNAVDHAVLVVGYDVTNPEAPFWKIRNTWGPLWGERGYFRMSMDAGFLGSCQMYVYGGYYPTEVMILEAGVHSQAPGAPSLRLVRDGRNSLQRTGMKEGRLEVLWQSRWGSVCFRGATHSAARVACHQMGKGAVGYATAASVYGGPSSSSQQRLGSLRCSGKEAKLQDCTFPGWADATCSGAEEDTGLHCGYFQTRLLYAKGTPRPQRIYRVEVRFNGEWGTACSNSFSPEDARVLCRSAGLGSTGRVVRLSAGSRPPAGRPSQPVWLDGPGCSGSEGGVQLCKLPGLIGVTSCGGDHSGDVGIQCFNEGGAPPPRPASNRALRPKVVVDRFRP